MITEQLQNLSYKSNDDTDVLKLSDVQALLANYACYPIGKRRHPFADVIHQWVEGSSMEVYDTWKNKWDILPFSFDTEYRIKELTPIYEYLWMDLRTHDVYGLPTDKYMTDEEAAAYFNTSTYFKIERTGKIRVDSIGGSEIK